ncbi:MAG: ABC transporter substrate-binding protein [Dokdonella sp.]|uniref:MlaC/ttg2D family ABC transporter substrate-binding protein n=2 Tax=Dokdonella sp. TaxID=2291710 RepID=UPI002BEB9AEE|nr:ABC transporter substrate-binding protein [Dokdonella sp.]HOX70503.1 ABC transporter substrate-binding protein [Dokdonella sp.]HPN78241.1 ABC transporter substrate-binding protein [Dokdonella sp.]
MRQLMVWILALMAGIALAQPARAGEMSPGMVVQKIADDLADSIGSRREELKNDHEKLIREIDAILLPHFDIEYASLLVLGRSAREATPEQRSRFAKAFYNSIAHRYAEGLLNYTRGNVRVLPFKGELNDKRTIVRTEVVLDDGKSVAVDYAFRKSSSDDWKAYDVIIEGISYITNYRNQVAAEIQASSLDSLIQRLESQGEKALESLEKRAGSQ